MWCSCDSKKADVACSAGVGVIGGVVKTDVMEYVL